MGKEKEIMGLYDYIKGFRMRCPQCKKWVDGFQTKDYGCSMEHCNFWEVKRFYHFCPECGCWIEFNAKFKHRPNRKITIDDYNMTFEKKDTEEEMKQKLEEITEAIESIRSDKKAMKHIRALALAASRGKH